MGISRRFGWRLGWRFLRARGFRRERQLRNERGERTINVIGVNRRTIGPLVDNKW
jgi:hypothetical protein